MSSTAPSLTLPISLPAPRAVIYDWDNTLADNWGAIKDAMNHTLVTFGLAPWSAAEARVRIKQSLRDAFPRLFGDRWEDARKVYYDHFSAHHLDHLKPMAGAPELLAMIAERGIYQAVVSNKTGHLLRAEAEALGWTSRFGRIVGANDATRDKPDPAPVLMALEGTGLNVEDGIWFVGDSDIDMQCAHAAGLTGVLIPPPDEGQAAVAAADPAFAPTLTFSSCMALSALVQGWAVPI